MRPTDPALLRISPLQMAVAAAALSNAGSRPMPRIALAVDTPQQGWVALPALEASQMVFDPSGANSTAAALVVKQETYWEYLAIAQSESNPVTWYLAGTVPNWQGTPMVVAVLIEGNDPRAAQVGRQVLHAALNP